MDAPSLVDLVVVAGEPSGDAYGAAIVRSLRQRRADLTVAAMGGQHLSEAGAEIIHDFDGMAVMGFLPVLARLPFFMRVGRDVAKATVVRRPRVVLTIDYPGFNLRLARRLANLRREGCRFIHVVAPQVWAWRPRRAKRIAHSVDRLLCYFPFEPPLFNRFRAADAEFVGHPLVDLVPERIDTAGIDAELGITAEVPLLLLAPGSREREIESLLPRFQTVAEALVRQSGGRIAVAVAKVPERPMSLYRRHTHFPLVEGRYRELCARARAGLIASGTATLEAGIIGLPSIIAYHLDPVTAAFARHLVLTDHIGLPNLILGRRVMPEVLQEQCEPVRLYAHLRRLWDDGPHRTRALAGLAEVRGALGAGGALDRIAAIVDHEISRGHRRDTGFSAKVTSSGRFLAARRSDSRG